MGTPSGVVPAAGPSRAGRRSGARPSARQRPRGRAPRPSAGTPLPRTVGRLHQGQNLSLRKGKHLKDWRCLHQVQNLRLRKENHLEDRRRVHDLCAATLHDVPVQGRASNCITPVQACVVCWLLHSFFNSTGFLARSCKDHCKLRMRRNSRMQLKKGDAPKKGTTIVGHPASSPVATVPANTPPDEVHAHPGNDDLVSCSVALSDAYSTETVS